MKTSNFAIFMRYLTSSSVSFVSPYASTVLLIRGFTDVTVDQRFRSSSDGADYKFI